MICKIETLITYLDICCSLFFDDKQLQEKNEKMVLFHIKYVQSSTHEELDVVS